MIKDDELNLYDLVADLFMAYNRNIETSKGLIENYCNKLRGLDLYLLENIMASLAREKDRLPRWAEIETVYRADGRSGGIGVGSGGGAIGDEDDFFCDKCGNEGLISVVKCIDTGGELYSTKYPVRSSNGGDARMFRTTFIGRCDCRYGDGFRRFPVIQPPGFIEEYRDADDACDSCNYAANRISIEMNNSFRLEAAREKEQKGVVEK